MTVNSVWEYLGFDCIASTLLVNKAQLRSSILIETTAPSLFQRGLAAQSAT